MKLEDLKDYKLVWADEFDGNELDPKKWRLEAMMGRSHRVGTEDLIYDLATDEKVVKVEDGMLKLNVYYDYERKTFVGPVSPCTRETMSFVYGYVEMRARVPYSHGTWPSFWMISRNSINQDKSMGYFGEVDIFEVNGTMHYAVPNLHKWYYGYYDQTSPYWEKGRPSNDAFETSLANGTAPATYRQGKVTPKDTEGFNTYGFLWTPEKMEMYLNGELYGHFDLTQDFGRASGMSGFHQPQFFVMNNYLLVDSSKSARMQTEHATPEDVETQVPYEIEYIRLYQREGEGELNIAE